VVAVVVAIAETLLVAVTFALVSIARFVGRRLAPSAAGGGHGTASRRE
jgi:hypothetical protein